mgnify:CR=1 FL=1
MAETNTQEAKSGFIAKIASLLTGRNVPRDAPEPGDNQPGLTTRVGKDLQDTFQELFGPSRDRFDAYRDYDDMEADSPLVCSALDATADTAVSGAEGDAESVFELLFPDGKENAKLTKLFTDLDDRTQVRGDAWKVIRAFLQSGDAFQEIVIDSETKNRIASLKPLPCVSMRVVPEEVMRRKESPYGYEQWNPETGGKEADFFPWQVVHYATKIRPEDIYGRSMLFGVRRTYRQLQTIEDAVVVNRLTRATMRYVRTVPTPNMTAEAAHKFVDKMQSIQGRRRRWDPNTGKLILENAPLAEETDFWVADMGNGVKGDVQTLAGQAGSERIEDVEYFQRKMFAGLRVPPSYLGWEKDAGGKAQSVTIDIAFARMVRRAQLTHGMGVRRIFDTEIALAGTDPATVEYDLMYAPIATVDEMRRWQTELLKVQVASLMKQGGLVLDDEYLLRHVLEIEEEYVDALIKKAEEEKKRQDELANQIASGAVPGAGGALPGVPGGQPAGEGPPKPGREGGIPPVRGGANGPAEQLREVRTRLRRRGLVVPHHVEAAVRGVCRRPSFLRQLEEAYSLTKPLRVTAKDSEHNGTRRVIMEAAGIG